MSYDDELIKIVPKEGHNEYLRLAGKGRHALPRCYRLETFKSYNPVPDPGDEPVTDENVHLYSFNPERDLKAEIKIGILEIHGDRELYWIIPLIDEEWPFLVCKGYWGKRHLSENTQNIFDGKIYKYVEDCIIQIEEWETKIELVKLEF